MIKRALLWLLVSGATVAVFSQSAEELRSLRRDIDAVRDGLKVIQNDIEIIKKLLQSGAGAPAPGPAPFTEKLIGFEGASVMGDKKAKVTIVEFTDYQCPFCAKGAQQIMPQVISEFVKSGKVQYVKRDYPLEQIHPHAFKAAEAARCAGEQGKFWEMHERLFANQTALALDQLGGHAAAVGLDGAKFQACLSSGKMGDKVRGDLLAGKAIGVTGTPGYYIGLTEPNGTSVRATKMISGAQAYANFKDAITALLGN